LVVLTSRFPYADLTNELGDAVRLLELERLTPAEGSRLLGRLDVAGGDADREAVSRRLEGHPLALRVFAAALTRQARSDPTRLLDVPFATSNLLDEDPLERKVRLLLAFYERQLPPAWRGLLGVVALFPDEVDLTAIVELGRRLPRVHEELAGATDGALRGALVALSMDGLLTRERGPDGEERYACHPVVRAHFRSALLGHSAEVATTAADLLAGQGQRVVEQTVNSRDELGRVTNAIALLLEAAQVEQADALYRERLGNGAAFRRLPAVRDGVQCTLGFVADEQRGSQVRRQLSTRRLGFYLNALGIFALNAAEFELADRHLRDAVDIRINTGDDHAAEPALLNLGELLIHRGRLTEAEVAIRDSLALSRRLGSEEVVVRSLAYRGWVFGLQGSTSHAIESFREALEVERWTDSVLHGLYSLGGIWWAELLLRLGHTGEARQATDRNLEICARSGWHQDSAGCQLLLGRLDAMTHRLTPATINLTHAATTFRIGHMLPELTDVLLAQADLDRGQRAWTAAESHIAEALRLASSRSMRLKHADALVLRGRIALDQHASPLAAAEALDDAAAALTIARQCGYAWAERDALQLKADALAEAGERDGAHAARREAEAMTRRLIPADLDLSWVK
jgi:hypothetical protein